MQETAPYQKKHDPFILGISSDKGGVGKTFTTENIAYLFSLECKVLVIDLDLQANLTSTYYSDADPEDVKGSETIFDEEPLLSFVPALIDGKPSKTLFICVVNSRFGPALNAANGRAGVEHLLMEAIKHTDHDFDVIIIDTPPAPRSIQKNNTLAAAHLVLLLVTDDANSFKGGLGLVQAVSKINDNNPTILMIQNLYQKARKSLNTQAVEWGNAAVDSINEYKAEKGSRIKPFNFVLLPQVIPMAAIASDAHSNGFPIDLVAPKCTTNIAHKQLLTTIKEYM